MLSIDRNEAMKQNSQEAEHLERVIEKNEQYLDSVAGDLLRACLGAGTARDIPPAVIENVLQIYSTMQVRLAEIEVVRALLLRRHNRQIPESPQRSKRIAELDSRIRFLTGCRGESAPSAAGISAGTSRPGTPADRPPSDRWLRIEQDSLAFTINARLLDELEYETPPRPGGPVRVVQKSGRGFTLFTLRGPASALDALYPCIRLRQHDIVERFSATEIRGVLTHLRQTVTGDIKHVFERLLTTRFSDVKCVLMGLQSPDQLDEHFLEYLERMVGKMRHGEIRTIDIASHT